MSMGVQTQPYQSDDATGDRLFPNGHYYCWTQQSADTVATFLNV